MSFQIDAKMSNSQLNNLHTCRLKWYFGHALHYTPLARSEHLDLGVGLHSGLAAYYKSGKDPIRVFQKWIDKEIKKVMNLMDTGGPMVASALANDVDTLTASRKLGTHMLEQYLIHHAHERFDILEVEKEVFKPIPKTDWDYHAIIDLLVRDARRKNRIYVVDHKSFSRFYMKYLEKDHQFVSYTWAAQDLIDEPIAGVIYNGIRKVQPGSQSKAAMFERHTLDINANQVKVWLKRMRDTYKTLTAGRFAIYPEPSSMSCSYCEFADPCMLYMKGDDWQFLLDNLFTKKPEREYE